jgi:hypothetical protein
MAKNAEKDVLLVGDMPILGGGRLPLYLITTQSEKKTGRTVWRLKAQKWVGDQYRWETVAQRYSRQELERIIDAIIVRRVLHTGPVENEMDLIQKFETIAVNRKFGRAG